MPARPPRPPAFVLLALLAVLAAPSASAARYDFDAWYHHEGDDLSSCDTAEEHVWSWTNAGLGLGPTAARVESYESCYRRPGYEAVWHGWTASLQHGDVRVDVEWKEIHDDLYGRWTSYRDHDVSVRARTSEDEVALRWQDTNGWEPGEPSECKMTARAQRGGEAPVEAGQPCLLPPPRPPPGFWVADPRG